MLRKKMQQLDESNRKRNEFEYEMKKSESVIREVEQYRVRYGELNRKFSDYESKIALLSQEIERLNHVLKKKEEDIQQLRSKNMTLGGESQKTQSNFYRIESEYKSQISRLTILSQNYEYKINELTQINQLNENKIEQLVQQLRSSPSKAKEEASQFY